MEAGRSSADPEPAQVMPKRGRAPGAREEAAERRRQAWDLRKGGASLREIARLLAVGKTTAEKYIDAGVADFNLKTSEDVKRHRALELARLDGLFQAAWLGATGPRADPTFILRAVQIIRERAKLLGLYAPIRIELAASDLARQLVKEFAERGEELDYEMALEEAERVLRGE